MRKQVFLLFLLIACPTFILAGNQKEKSGFGIQIGYWKPSFNEINNGLKELQQAAMSQDIFVSGETEIGGMVDIGISLVYKINKRFYYQKGNFGESTIICYNKLFNSILTSFIVKF